MSGTPPLPPDPEAEYLALLDTTHKRLWLSFQTTAGSVAKLYRDGSSTISAPHAQGEWASGAPSDPLWAAFQGSAGSLTQFYKDTLEAMNTVQDKAVHYGYQKRRREMGVRSAAARRQKAAAASQRYYGCGGAAATQGMNPAGTDGNLQGDAAAAVDGAMALEYELEKTMLSDDMSASPLRTHKRRQPPTDDILEAIFIKRARPS